MFYSENYYDEGEFKNFKLYGYGIRKLYDGGIYQGHF